MLPLMSDKLAAFASPWSHFRSKNTAFKTNAMYKQHLTTQSTLVSRVHTLNSFEFKNMNSFFSKQNLILQILHSFDNYLTKLVIESQLAPEWTDLNRPALSKGLRLNDFQRPFPNYIILRFYKYPEGNQRSYH